MADLNPKLRLGGKCGPGHQFLLTTNQPTNQHLLRTYIYIYTSEELTEKPTVYIDWCVFIFNQKKHRQILSKSLWQKHGMVRHPPRVDGSLHRCSVAFHMSLQSQGFFHNIKEKITGLGVILSYQLFVCNWLLLPFWLLTSSSAPPKNANAATSQFVFFLLMCFRFQFDVSCIWAML